MVASLSHAELLAAAATARLIEVPSIQDRVIDTRPGAYESPYSYESVIRHYFPRLRRRGESRYRRGYIYVIEFSRGWVKFGQSNDPALRVRQNKNNFRARHELEMIRVWISNATMSPAKVEEQLRITIEDRGDGQQLHHSADRYSTSIGESELLHGVAFSEVVATAKELNYEPVDPRGSETGTPEERTRDFHWEMFKEFRRHLKSGGTFRDFDVPVLPGFENTGGLSSYDFSTREGLIEFVLGNPRRRSQASRHLSRSKW